MTRRFLMLAASAGFSIFLVVLLFRVQHITVADVVNALAATPPMLLGTVLAMTLANQLAGVARWRAANAWLSPDSPHMTFIAMLEATTWGAFLGQLIPPQFSMSFARWAASRHSSAVGVTLYEGVFDFVILTSGALAALAVLVLGAGSEISLPLFVGGIFAGCISIRWVMSAGCVIARRYSATHLPGRKQAEQLSPALRRASNAPARTLAVLCAWSFVRMTLLALRMVIVAVTLIPGLHWVTVLVGYPIVGLAVSVPFLPAGLGLAEWSWTGLLSLAGATASVAALTAVVFRIINFVALCGITLLATMLGRSSSLMTVKQASARQS